MENVVRQMLRHLSFQFEPKKTYFVFWKNRVFFGSLSRPFRSRFRIFTFLVVFRFRCDRLSRAICTNRLTCCTRFERCSCGRDEKEEGATNRRETFKAAFSASCAQGRVKRGGGVPYFLFKLQRLRLGYCARFQFLTFGFKMSNMSCRLI